MRRNVLGLLLILACALSVTAWSVGIAVTSGIRVRVRDSVTGRDVESSFLINSSRARSLFQGRGIVDASKGDHDVEISAPGFRSLQTHIWVDSVVSDVVVWLDPENQDRRPPAEDNPTDALLYGNAYYASGLPIANARVYLENSSSEARTDSSGYFEMRAPVTGTLQKGDLPETCNIAVETGGMVIYRRLNMPLTAGSTHVILDAENADQTVVDSKHKLELSFEELAKTQTLEAETLPPTVQDESRPLSTGAVPVPASIRVGSSCGTKTTCSVVNVYTLDTYTRLGLDDEWIASWNTNSLKAGAIAFRTYGAYHVFHPLTANYDICNTTSCQVLDPTDSFSASDTATAQTTGTIVTNSTGTDALFAEYAAENNNGGCSDGFTGNNTTWPCLADAVDAGQTFNGHGRGMCQWGTQRWATNQGKDFIWITNHYYNANGDPSGLRNGVLQLGPNTILPPPDLTSPGTDTAPGKVIITTTPTFSWQPVNGADGYALFVSKFNGASYDLIFDSSVTLGAPITTTSYTLPTGLLQSGSDYRWNVATHNAGGYGSANTFRSYFNVRDPLSVSGRVLSPTGRVIRNAYVVITDLTGTTRNRSVRADGSYNFGTLVPGQSYRLSASSSQYTFTPVQITVSGNLSNLDLIALDKPPFQGYHTTS